MDNIQKTQAPVDEQELDNKLGELLKEAEKINQEIRENGIRTDEKLTEIESQVGESVAKIEKIHAEIDQAEAETVDELDKIILERIEQEAEDDESEERTQ